MRVLRAGQEHHSRGVSSAHLKCDVVSVGPINADINSDLLVKLMTARFPHFKFTPSPL